MARLTDRLMRRGMRPLRGLAWSTALAAGVASVAVPSLLIAQAPPPANQADPAANLLLKASGLFQRQLYRPAIADFQQFIQQFPNHAQVSLARYSLAVCHYRLSEFDAAVPLLEQVSADAKFTERDSAFVVLAHCHLIAGKYDKAVTTTDALLAAFPQSKHAETASLYRMQALHAGGKHEAAATAAATFAKAYPQSPNRPLAMYAQGLSEKALNRDADAAKTLGTLLAENPKFDRATDALLTLGQALEAQGQLDKAVERYREMLAGASPIRQPDAHYSLGAALYRLGKFDDAATEFTALLQKRPATAGNDGKIDKLAAAARLQLGLSQLAAKKVADARKTLTAVLKDDTDNTPAARYGIAQCDIADGKFDAALAAIQDLAKLNPPPVPASQLLFDRAACLSQINDHTKAAEAFATFIKENPASPLIPEATYRQAFSLHQLKDYAGSTALCAKLAAAKSDFTAPAADLDAENLFLLAMSADAATANVKFAAASKAYTALLSTSPNDDRTDRIFLRLGQCAYSQGDYTKAIEHLSPLAAKPKAASDDVLGRGVFLLGDAYLQLKKYSLSAEAFQKYLGAIKAGSGEKADKQEAQYKLAIAQLRALPEGSATPPAVKQAFATVAAGPADSPWTARGYFELGQLAYQAKPPKLDEAADAFGKVLASNNGKPPADLAAPSLYYQGWIEFDRNQPTAANDKWAKVVAEHPKSLVAADAAYFQGVALRKLDKHQAAVDAFAAYEKAYPDGKRLNEARQLTAKSLIALDKHAEAAKILASLGSDKSLAADVVLYDLAWAQKGAKDSVAAMATYRKLIADNASSTLVPAARTELAELLAKDDKHAEAVELLTAVTTSQGVPADVRSAALYRLGESQAKLNQIEKAADAFALFAKDFPEDKLAAAALAQAGAGFAGSRRFDDAEKQFAELLRRFPGDTNAAIAQLQLGEAQADASKFDAALASHQKFLQKYPTHQFAYRAQFGIGWAQENLKQYDAARAAYTKVTTTHTGEYAARAQFQIGETYFTQGKHDKAAEALLAVEDVYAYPQWSARALIEAGRAYELLKQNDVARKLYETVVTKYKAQANELKQAQERLAQLK